MVQCSKAQLDVCAYFLTDMICDGIMDVKVMYHLGAHAWTTYVGVGLALMPAD